MKINIRYFISGLFAVAAISCNKIDLSPRKNHNNSTDGITYLIKQGQHFSDHNDYMSVELTECRFTVKFDNSAMYETNQVENQLDVNKLFGFSDNDAGHHLYSARFGWRWSDNALRLFAYVYNNSEMSYEEIDTINIGEEYTCSIKVVNTSYVFTLNDKVITMPRISTMEKAKGYKLYPYFGGDEPAPHDIRIWIKELNH